MAGSMIFGASKPKKPPAGPMNEGAPEEFGAGEDLELASMADEEIDVYGETEAEAMKVLAGKVGQDGADAIAAYVKNCIAKEMAKPSGGTEEPIV